MGPPDGLAAAGADTESRHREQTKREPPDAPAPAARGPRPSCGGESAADAPDAPDGGAPEASAQQRPGGCGGGGADGWEAGAGPYSEVLSFALPMLATLAADPVASLVDTAFVGHLGAAQLAGVGTAMSIYDAATRIFNASLLAVATSQIAAAMAAPPADAPAPAPDGGAPEQGRSEEAWEPRGKQQRQERLASESRGGAPPAGAGGRALPAVGSADAIMVLDEAEGQREHPTDRGRRAAAAAAAEEGAAVGCAGAPGMLEGARVPSEEAQPKLGAWSADEGEAADRGVPFGGGGSGGSGGGGGGGGDPARQRRLDVASSTALALALGFGLLEAAALVPGAPRLADAWGAPEGSPPRAPALAFLRVRGAAAPLTVLLLVLQGVFRGLQDASTPLYATLLCNAVNLGLEYPFIFKPLGLGAAGSAAATAAAEGLALLALLAALRRRHGLGWGLGLVDWGHLGAMFKPTGFLVLRSICVSAVFAVAMATAARAGPVAAAAHQVALQLWLSSSLMADALAAAAQTLVAAEVAASRPRRARALVRAALACGAALGALLGALLWAGAGALPALFTADLEVLRALRPLMAVVAATQPLNAAAFVLDGVLYGAGGFRYASAMMLPCAAASLAVMLGGARRAAAAGEPPEAQLLWVWAGLAALMALRVVGVGAPLLLRRYPLGCLFSDKGGRAAPAAGARRQPRRAASGRRGGEGSDLEAPLLGSPCAI